MALAAVGSNLITFVFGELHFPLSQAANVVTNFVGTVFILSPLGGFLSDSYAGCFRTLLPFAAVELAERNEAGLSESKRKRAVSAAMKAVSSYLGNTPTVARASYVDPRVIDLFQGGETIEHVLPDLGEGNAVGEPATHGVVERAVLDLLS